MGRFAKKYWHVLAAVLIVYSATIVRTMESDGVDLDFLRDVGMPLGMPVVEGYHYMRQSSLLNIEVPEGNTLVKIGDWFLTPSRYAFGGKTVRGLKGPIDQVEVWQQFNYQTYYGYKTTVSMLSLPTSVTIGGAFKSIGLLFPDSARLYKKLKEYQKDTSVHSQNEFYHSLGIGEFYSTNTSPCQEIGRDPSVYEQHKAAILALKEITELLDEEGIVHWMDCGTALGVYRHGGVIPWDHDVDLSVFQLDHDNLMRVLKRLPKDKYEVQDWSSYNAPKTFIKVYVKEIRNHIDIYHYLIEPHKKWVRYFYSYEHSPIPRGVKLAERVMTNPLTYDQMFPLRKGNFDGVQVWVPNDLVTFLKSKYGGNLDPSKVWDSQKERYEKVEGHPYWDIPHL